MIAKSRANDRPYATSFARWNAVSWVLLGLLPTALAVLDSPDARKYWSLGVLGALALCCGALFALRSGPALRPLMILSVFALGLGGTSYVLEGAAALYVVSLPLFWIYARDARSSVVLSGLAALATVFGGTLPQGWSPQFLTGNNVVTVAAFAAGAALGLWVHRFVGQSDMRAAQLTAELESAQRRLVEAYRRQGAVEERERLARDIHDTLAQGFASIIVLAEAARSSADSDPARRAQQLLSIERTARENFTEARILVGSAPSGTLAAGSLAETLGRTLDRFAEDTGLAVSAELPDIDCDRTARIALLRCTQESLANIRKHAAASTVGVVLARHEEVIELEITDDGCGFVVEESLGFGLNGMRKRLAEMGGELTVTSSVGDGTRVLASLPAPEASGTLETAEALETAGSPVTAGMPGSAATIATYQAPSMPVSTTGQE
ncbi:sensor histidine kinase [Streptomyces sp. NPDC057781]|uniref:sensor histidine kinase n=1 Tax=unclassified Streptomyces TaxID=2593676 RepID=UPI00368816DD